MELAALAGFSVVSGLASAILFGKKQRSSVYRVFAAYVITYKADEQPLWPETPVSIPEREI